MQENKDMQKKKRLRKSYCSFSEKKPKDIIQTRTVLFQMGIELMKSTVVD